MQSTKKRLFWLTAVFLLLACLLPVRAFAAETEKAVSVQLPVSCTGTNTEETFLYELTQQTTEYQTVESATLSLKNGESGAFHITYTYPGAYHYTVRQAAGDDAATTYDKTVYTVDVYVQEDETGELSAEVVVYTQGSAGKMAEMLFTNARELPTPTPTPSGTPETTETPESPEPLWVPHLPQTGDNAQLGLWVLLAAVSAAALALLAVLKRKKKEEGSHE